MEELEYFKRALARGQSVVIEELWQAPKAYLATLAAQVTGKHLVIVTEGELELDFPYFRTSGVRSFPAWDTFPGEEIPPSSDIVGRRYRLLREILRNEERFIILTSLQALLEPTISPEKLQLGSFELKVGQVVEFESLVTLLADNGYLQRAVASDKGEFAVRGGIIDLFPVDSPDPMRIEFFGDTIEAIRLFDPIGQKSLQGVEKGSWTPAQELALERSSTLFDYLGEELLLVIDDLSAFEDRIVELNQQFDLRPFQKILWPKEKLEALSPVKKGAEGLITFSLWDQEIEAKRLRSPFEPLEEIQELQERGLDLHFVTENESQEQHVRDLLPQVHFAGCTFERGYLSSGYILGQDAVIPLAFFTGHHKVRRDKQRSTHHTAPIDYQELLVGDLVVHFHQGIGRFLGFEKKKDHEGIEREFLALEYAEKGKLFVPLTQAHLLSKYIGAHYEERPKLSQLGSPRWAKIRASTELAIRDYAADLLKMQAEREVAQGFACEADSSEMLRFERDFPYVETEDQLAAIAAVKKDMQDQRPMDRLVCGDVGYGKTEVAMRAAFKAIVDGGKQVAVLVPTTVLAMQHFETFSERMENFPIRVAVLCRFRSPKEQKKTLEEVRQGSVDLVIGTHRLLSQDVGFKNLGLIIIDEEQKFGVRVKERLRNFKVGVDCLTMSATPIPRTLYFSLMGARDLSVINSPPSDRLPIKTILCEDDDETLQLAINRELNRGGQVYVIHNLVETILSCAERVQRLVPTARIVVGHGQMDGDALDEVFHAFKSGAADVLVATTIVENGIDIPNANTIIVERADCYGLADLYQLRGRVGRWNRRAFAYLFIPKKRALAEWTEKRLSALLEIGGYGGGMKLAMRDLELRGAGNLLGTQQSGHASAVGFHLYCKLLKRQIEGLQGKGPFFYAETRLEIPVSAHLPASYVNDTNLQLQFYSRLGEASLEQIDEIALELRDRFGPLPEEALYLLAVMRIRAVANQKRVIRVTLKKYTLVLETAQGTKSTLIAAPKSPHELEKRIIQEIQKF
ncbi:MAG: transcription-repair coupling factor [Verrucomicrobia bacterium]|nr:transcription-repair coupling factor [Verrucomicrobiota bacterium]